MYCFFIIALIFLAAFIIFYKSKIKGRLGEYRVSCILNVLPEEKYRVINNVMIETGNGLSQIDHIVVSIYGIFVIETKNYKGWIYGTENSQEWTKNVYGKKYQFYNPIKQNYGHIMALAELLNLSKDIFVGIVAFDDSAELKLNGVSNVIYFSELEDFISSHSNYQLGQEQMNNIYDYIVSNNVDSSKNRNTHIQNIYQNKTNINEMINQGVCPRCGGRLVNRQGKYGAFEGCSNYPKCRYTKNV